MVWYDIWNNTVYWWANERLQRIACFFLGHDIKYSYVPGWESDWCARCHQDTERNERLAEERTVPVILGRVYCWLVEHDWPLWNRLDDWLMGKYRLPAWWEY